MVLHFRIQCDHHRLRMELSDAGGEPRAVLALREDKPAWLERLLGSLHLLPSTRRGDGEDIRAAACWVRVQGPRCERPLRTEVVSRSNINKL